MNEESIFSKALEFEAGAARDQFLDSVCGKDLAQRKRIDQLLAEYADPDSFFDRGARPEAVVATTTASQRDSDSADDDIIENYRLLHVLGEGGMGTVYLAQQHQPVRRRVAVKIIKQGMNSKQFIARFDAERQALAMMDHPNIAKVLDAGCTRNGRPYFVMELVKGIPITDFCDQNRLGTTERLNLFVQVCLAVQHAHQKGIIHRDLKPTNVLVAMYDNQPVPKVIDFGVAKATHQPLTENTLCTIPGQIVGTWEYMSPEQAILNQLDVDTRTDIYSLGVILYELLTGKTPLDLKSLNPESLEERLRRIREEQPSRPSIRVSSLGKAGAPLATYRNANTSELTRSLKGDLDWIVMKALEKDRARRYDTASGFAAEIRRYLADEPLSFRPPSSWEQLARFYRSNKVFARTGAAIATSLVIGLCLALWGMGQARRAEQQLSEKVDQLETATNELTEERITFAKSYFYTNMWRADFRTAHEMLDQAYELNVDDLWLRNAAAMLASFEGRTVEAREQLEGVLGKTPNDIFARSLLAMIDYWDGNEAAFIETITGLRKEPPNSLTFDEKLMVAYAYSHPYPEDALRLLEELESQQPRFPVIRLLRASAYLYLAFQRLDARDAFHSIEKAIDDLEFVKGPLEGSALASHVIIMTYLHARNICKELARDDPTHVDLWNKRAEEFEQIAKLQGEDTDRLVEHPESLWAVALLYRELDDDTRFNDLAENLDSLSRSPYVSHLVALHHLESDKMIAALEALKKSSHHPSAARTKFLDFWVRIAGPNQLDELSRAKIKDEFLSYVNGKIQADDDMYLAIDMSVLLLLGDRRTARELASRFDAAEKDRDWWAPLYRYLQSTEYDPQKLVDDCEQNIAPRAQLTHAYFLLGCDATGRGDESAAKRYFEKCIEQGCFFYWVDWASQAFLSRMEKGWTNNVESKTPIQDSLEESVD